MEQKRLKIGLFNDSFYPMQDGVINVVDNYAKRLSKIADVTVFAPKSRVKGYVDNFPYKVVRCKKSFKSVGLDYDLPMPDFDVDFMKEVNSGNFDIVHIHSPFTIGRVGLKYSKKHHIPCVATIHSQFKMDFFEATKSETITSMLVSNIISAFNACDICWTVNEGITKLYQSDEYKLKSYAVAQYNACDMKPIEDKSSAYQFINDYYKLNSDDVVFCFVGRIHVLKNIFFIVDALNELKKRDFHFKMLFVGDGPDMPELKKQIKEYGLDDFVVFTGKISDKIHLAKIYARSNLLLFPSKYDTDGIVKYEAASQGTPTLTIKDFYCASNIVNNETGYISENSISGFANKIQEIFSNKDLYDKVCQNVATKLYRSWDDAVLNVYNDYLDIIKKYHEGYYKNLKNYIKVKKVGAKKHTAKKKKKEIIQNRADKNIQKLQTKIEKIQTNYTKKLTNISTKKIKKIK